jgi:hypothetical protein
MTGLKSRIVRIEQRIGTDDAPRRVMIRAGPQYDESWIEFGHGWKGNDVSLHVKIPDRDSDPMGFLTAEQRAVIRRGDSLVTIVIADNERDSQLELNRPPWKRNTSNFVLSESVEELAC